MKLWRWWLTHPDIESVRIEERGLDWYLVVVAVSEDGLVGTFEVQVTRKEVR